MAIAHDASSPAAVVSVNTVTSVATASFTPPADSRIVVGCMDCSTGGLKTFTPGNTGFGGTLTWTSVASHANEACQLFISSAVPSATAGTVTCTTAGGATGQWGIIVSVWTGVQTGAITFGSNVVGARSNGSTSATNSISPTIVTTTANNSQVVGLDIDDAALGAMTSTDSNTPLVMGTTGDGIFCWTATPTTTSGTAVALNFDAGGTGTAAHRYVGFELLPAAVSGDATANAVAATVTASASNLGIVPSEPQHIETAAGAMAATRSPSITFTTQPQTNDLIIMWPSSTVSTAVATAPSGWTSPLTTGDSHPSNTASQIDCKSDAHEIGCIWHLVTSTEFNANTLTYTATNYYDVTQTGRVHAMLVRYADTTTPILAAWSAEDISGTATPHILAGLTSGLVTASRALVASSVAADGTGTYGTPPTGWTVRSTAGTTMGRWTGTRDALTTSGVAVAATNITPSAGDEYASITVAVKLQPPPSADGTANAVAASVTVTATDPVGATAVNAAAVAATVTASAANPSASGPGTANAVAAVVTVTATDPVSHGTGTASAVAATVTATATNPVGAPGAAANAVAALVAATAANPVSHGTGTANAVAALVAASAANPVARGAGTASAVAASVTVTATNPVATAVGVPGAPTGLTPTAGSGQVALSWTAPASNGGSALTDYVVQYRPAAMSEQFSGSSLDAVNFIAYNRLGDQVNGEVNAVIPANAVVSSGTAKIISKFEDVVAGDTTTGAPNPRTVHYTSAQIAEPSPRSFRYGSVQVRAKIAGGTGTWPCIWMLGTNWQASQPATANVAGADWPNGGWWEIDIAEFVDGHRSLQNCQLHFITPSRGGSGEKTIPFDATTRFMVYRLDWTATSLVWKIDAEDGNGFVTLLTITGVAGTDIPNTAGYLIIHTAIGGSRGGTPDSSTFPVQTEVDWVTVDPDWLTFSDGTSTATTATVTGLTNEIPYDFRVAAVNAIGQGPYLSTATATPTAGSVSASANAVAATVTATASNPVAHGTGTANAVAATVTATATNPGRTVSSAASVVAATVAASATDPTFTVSSAASVVGALVTVTATNPVGSVSGAGTAGAVNALVAVTASNPAASGTATASALTATVTATATNPARTVLSNASVVAASVAVTATNPTTTLTAGATPAVALVTGTASNPVVTAQGDGTAHPVVALVAITATNPGAAGTASAFPGFAAITAGATNPTFAATATATVIVALVIVTATNPTVGGGASTFFFGVRRTVRRDPIRRSIRVDPLRRSKKVQ